MTGAIAIFVKTPGLSPVKTRLATGIGRDAAEAWYLSAAAAVAAVARAVMTTCKTRVYWAIAESDSAEADSAEADLNTSTHWTDFQKLAQGEDGLGARMARVHNALVEQHGHAILLGADTPQIDATELGSALQWLTAPPPRACMGPARDGGFWMFGSNRCIALGQWNSVAYSHADTREHFQHALSRYDFDWQLHALRTDVDTASDLQACLTELEALPSALPEQTALASHIRELLEHARSVAATS